MKNEEDKTQRVNICLPKNVVSLIKEIKDAGYHFNVSKIGKEAILREAIIIKNEMRIKSGLDKFSEMEQISMNEIIDYCQKLEKTD